MSQDTLQAAINDFVIRVREITRTEMIGALQATLAGHEVGNGRRGRAAPPRAPTGGTRRAKGAKRDAKDLSALVGKLEAAIKAKPGQRIEEIGRAMNTPTKELALPIKKLLGGKKISKKGNRRATKYFPK